MHPGNMWETEWQPDVCVGDNIVFHVLHRDGVIRSVFLLIDPVDLALSHVPSRVGGGFDSADGCPIVDENRGAAQLGLLASTRTTPRVQVKKENELCMLTLCHRRLKH